MIVYLVMGYLTGSMALQAHSKTNSLKDIIWRYITKYSTQHFVLVFSASLVRLLLVSFCHCHLFPSWLVVFRREDSIGRRLQKSRSQSGLIHALCLHPLKSFFFFCRTCIARPFATSCRFCFSP